MVLVCACVSLGVGQGGRAGHGKEGSEYGCTEEGATAVIKCPAGPWRGLPRPRAMLMSTPGGQGCLLSACWTIWWKRCSTGGLPSLQMTNIPLKEEGNFH